MRPNRKPCRKAVKKRPTFRGNKAHPKAPITEPSMFSGLICMLVFLLPDGLRGFLNVCVASSVAFMGEVTKSGVRLVPLGSFSSYRMAERPSPSHPTKVELGPQSIDNRRVASHTRKAGKICLIAQRWNQKNLRSASHVPHLSFVSKMMIVFSGYLPDRLRVFMMRSMMKNDAKFALSYNRLKAKPRQIISSIILKNLPLETNTNVRSCLLQMASALRGCCWKKKERRWDSIVASIYRGLENRIFEAGHQRGAALELLVLIWNERRGGHSVMDTSENHRLILTYMMYMIDESLTAGPPLTDYETKHMLEYGRRWNDESNVDIIIDSDYGIQYFIDQLILCQDSRNRDCLSEILIWTFYPSIDRTCLLIRFWNQLEDVFLNVSTSDLLWIVDDSALISRCAQSPSMLDRIDEKILKKSPGSYGQWYYGEGRDLSEIACAMFRDANYEQRQILLERGFLHSAEYLAYGGYNMDAAPVYRSVITQFPVWTRKFKKMTEGGHPLDPIVVYAASLPASPERRQDYCLEEGGDGTI